MTQTTSGISLDEKVTRKMADLARLELTDAEVKDYTSQLRDILGYFQQLADLDVSLLHQFDPIHSEETPLREDRVEPSLLDSQGSPKILGSAPDTLNDGFKVPPIL